MKKEAHEVKAEKVADAANYFFEISQKMDFYKPDEIAYGLVMAAANYIATEEGLEDLIKYLVFSYTMIEAVEDGRVQV
jgi:hypothetical protein